MNYIKISWDEFVATYKPIKNHIDSNASVDGYAFETYGEEKKAVDEAYRNNPKTVWTMFDSNENDNGDPDADDYEPLPLPIQCGFHFVNRLCYFITEVPFPRGVTIDVIDD